MQPKRRSPAVPRSRSRRTSQSGQSKARNRIRPVERLWRRVESALWAKDDRPDVWATLAPRQMEPRRLLDAAGAGLAAELTEIESDYVQMSLASTSSGAEESTAAAEDGNGDGENTPPTGIAFAAIDPINENDIAELRLSFEDPDVFDTHIVEVNWGDGVVEEFNVSSGSRLFSTTHQYLDDDPSITSSDDYQIEVTLRDESGESTTAETLITVNNVAPHNLNVVMTTDEVDEGSAAQLNLQFDDPGTLDTHVVDVNWGDGITETFNLVSGARFFSTSHIYADNGDYTIDVVVRDDDSGVAMASTMLTVVNVAPTMTVVGDQTIDEGLRLNISDLGVFFDPGFDNPLNTEDPANGGEVEETFTYEIDWGDGTPATMGDATVDQLGGPGVLTEGSFDAEHVYADNGLYTVTVTLMDDDGGVDVQTFQVTVNNVDPTTTTANRTVAEGESFTLRDLGIFLQDPGFDNPLNTLDPANGGEVEETFTAVSVDWGDGTPVDALAIVDRVSGSPRNATTGQFEHAPHVYADNGVYTVTVQVADDDGGTVERTFTIEVTNVAPTLFLTEEMFVINEGDELFIPELGKFDDPGFDNPLNTLDPANGGEVEETFTYTIDWGDGTVETGQLPARRVSGQPGQPTIGTIADRHRYLDNDEDNLYTITVTLTDDDGGTTVESFQVTVLNVNPTLQPISATDLDGSGVTTLTLEFSDPGADTFEILVDWGDQLNLPPEDRFVVETVHAGPTPQSFVLTHFYDGPPDPLHPAADIVISVKIRDDDFGTPMIVQIGESNVEIAVIANPGEGTIPIAIDTPPQVPQLVFSPPTQTVGLLNGDSLVAGNGGDGEISGSAGDTRAASERFFALRVIHPDGTESPAFRLPDEAMDDLPALFARLPDNHYKIYLVRTETNTWRLVLDVFVRNGKLIDPGDDSEGSRDRPPTDETVIQPNSVEDTGETKRQETSQTTSDQDQQTGDEPDGRSAAKLDAAGGNQPGIVGEPSATQPHAEQSDRSAQTALPSSYGTALFGVALALSVAGRRSAGQVPAPTGRPTAHDWKRLRIAGHFPGRKQ